MFRVYGRSMAPVLNDGDYVITKAVLPDDNLDVDDIVIFEHPDVGQAIKSIKKIRHKTVLFRGFSPLSMGPDEMGWINRDRITSRLVLTIGSTGISKLGKKLNKKS